MAHKDPAFLFYTSDFLTGTMFMTNEQVGIYIRLLCSQHQHGGMIDKLSFNNLVKEDHLIRSKFIETESGFYNERLSEEMILREKKSTNISEAVRKVWESRKESNGIPLKSQKKSKRKVMRLEDVNVNEIEDYFFTNGYSKESAQKFFKFYSEANWFDSKGNKVLNWKQKAQSTWFKEENKIMNQKPKEVLTQAYRPFKHE